MSMSPELQYTLDHARESSGVSGMAMAVTCGGDKVYTYVSGEDVEG